MFFIASKIFELIFAPAHFLIFLAVIGAALLYTRFSVLGRRLAATAAIALLVMAFGPVGQFLAAPLETRFASPPDDLPAPDGVIVLGGAVDEKLSALLKRPVIQESAERLTAPLALKRLYPNARLVFSGGSALLTEASMTEADVVRGFWRGIGLDTGDVLYESRSRNTYENALFTRELLQPKPDEHWLLVTSALHMPRAMGAFRKAGFSVTAYPVDFRTDGRMRIAFPRFATKALGLVDFAAHEWAGLVAYWLSGKSDALLPAP